MTEQSFPLVPWNTSPPKGGYADLRVRHNRQNQLLCCYRSRVFLARLCPRVAANWCDVTLPDTGLTVSLPGCPNHIAQITRWANWNYRRQAPE